MSIVYTFRLLLIGHCGAVILAIRTRFIVGVVVVKSGRFREVKILVNVRWDKQIVAVVASWPLALMSKNLGFQLNWNENPTLSQYPILVS